MDGVKADSEGVVDEETINAVCYVLSGINKNGKFESLREYFRPEDGEDEDEEDTRKSEKSEKNEESWFKRLFSSDNDIEKILKDSVFV